MEGHMDMFYIHVSDAECPVEKYWFMYTMSGSVF